jgi:flagellar protein FliT
MEHAHLSLYENVAEITGEMAQAARTSDWDRLVELEASCARHMASIMRLPLPELSSDERQRKVGIIRQILEHDREIRDLTVPWMQHLGALIGNARNERKLAGAYGA